MTPAVTGLIIAGLSELHPRRMLSVDHHMARFFVAAVLAIALALAGGNTSNLTPKSHAAPSPAHELGGPA